MFIVVMVVFLSILFPNINYTLWTQIARISMVFLLYVRVYVHDCVCFSVYFHFTVWEYSGKIHLKMHD